MTAPFPTELHVQVSFDEYRAMYLLGQFVGWGSVAAELTAAGDVAEVLSIVDLLDVAAEQWRGNRPRDPEVDAAWAATVAQCASLLLTVNDATTKGRETIAAALRAATAVLRQCAPELTDAAKAEIAAAFEHAGIVP